MGSLLHKAPLLAGADLFMLSGSSGLSQSCQVLSENARMATALLAIVLDA
jgi:hypothetical protein